MEDAIQLSRPSQDTVCTLKPYEPQNSRHFMEIMINNFVQFSGFDTY
jgi:hypothetical protein